MFNGQSFLTESQDGCLLAVIDVFKVGDERFADTSLIVRLDGDLIIIERDMNDKPLVDALVQAGVPRQQIILAYAGEVVPEPVEVA